MTQPISREHKVIVELLQQYGFWWYILDEKAA